MRNLIFLIACIVIAVLMITERGRAGGKALMSVATVIIISICTLYAFIMVAFSSVFSWFLTFFVIALGVVIMAAVIGTIWGIIKKKWLYIPLIVAFVICAGVIGGAYGYEAHIKSLPTVGESSNVLYNYSPFMEDSIVATLDEESSLKITEDLPVMDGATALYPVYAAFANAVYPREVFANEEGRMRYDNEYICCSTTAHAYERIVTGEADIIFVASPSEEQAQVAKDCGVELVFTPVGREAFVFFVNSKNPIENITLEDVQKIYSGEITEWSELGVKRLGKIRAFQREEGSGSQSTLEKLMAGKNLMEPPTENVVTGMGGIITKTADYKNYKNAIGYSFRFYSTEMVKNDMIKLLGINGIEPTLENIENGTYPVASEFYAVTRSDASENTLKLLEWVQGEQGQKIIELTGYTPLK